MSTHNTVVSQVIQERQNTHGEYKTTASIAQGLKRVVREAAFHNLRMSSMQVESIEFICTKVARILNGDPNHIDSWVDIAGYAQLVVNELQKGYKDEMGAQASGAQLSNAFRTRPLSSDDCSYDRND